MTLLIKAISKAISGILCLGLVLFLPAGTLFFPNAWLLIGILFLPMIAVGVALYIKAPALLEKRLNSKEGNSDQKTVILLSSLLFLAVFVLAGFDYRFGWSNIPCYLTAVSAVVFLAGYGMYVEVMRENAYLSRTVEVQDGQKVIDTGLYGIVRHPMYSATLLLFLSMPLVLGSWPAFLTILFCYPFIIAWRIRDEEKTLSSGLPGYSQYMQKVKYRMIPYIW